jgi:SAM-dependent methyltransferase/uncharacterized protein YndB with AHSA1/START domain
MTTGALQFSGAFAGVPAPPAFDLIGQARTFPPLGGVAFPVVQDRWERLVSMANIQAPANRVWEALIDPGQVRNWLAECHGKWATRDEESTLDFEDGEFFYCRTIRSSSPTAARPGILTYLWRWVGIGPATSVTWTVTPTPQGTMVTVVEEATNPPSDWRSWNGMGWPGILDQLAGYLRTGTNWRWPWRRMGPYLQIPLPMRPFQAWDVLTSLGAIKFWMQRTAGSFDPDDELTLVMGDASGTVKMRVTKSVDSGQDFPSYMPYIEFNLRRPAWTAALGGRMWIEPAGLGQSLLQIFHYDWERLDLHDPVTERKLLTNFWVNAAARAQMLFQPQGASVGPHGWSAGGGSPHSPNGEGGNGHGGIHRGGQAGSVGEVGRPNGQGNPAGNGNGYGSAPLTKGMPPDLDFAAAMGFAGKVMGDLGGAMTSIMSVLGVRLGLFTALASGPATSAELAGRTGCAERYLQEWLLCLTSAGYLRYDRADQRYTLSAERAIVLAFEGSPFCLADGYELLIPMVTMVDAVAEAFHTGQGIPYERYPMQLYTAMERMSSTWLDSMLIDQWLPAVDGLVARLEGSGKVADVGSGGGRALIKMAQRFGATQFVGYDLYAPNVERATEAARQAGVADRVRFENVDAVAGLTGPLDLVTMFDVLHDAPDPEALLGAAYAALVPTQGVLLVLESSSADNAEDNVGPLCAILYATSTLYCLPTALSEGGPGLGTLGLPPGELSALAGRAGFSSVDEVPISSPLNALYVLRP